ncbi:hypothetical protein HK102_003985 [Quaeritorhiza haematococci]|nr:hypothetical protein HK102_003985 [Quaeritorhiza haematococci]
MLVNALADALIASIISWRSSFTLLFLHALFVPFAFKKEANRDPKGVLATYFYGGPWLKGLIVNLLLAIGGGTIAAILQGRLVPWAANDITLPVYIGCYIALRHFPLDAIFRFMEALSPALFIFLDCFVDALSRAFAMATVLKKQRSLSDSIIGELILGTLSVTGGGIVFQWVAVEPFRWPSLDVWIVFGACVARVALTTGLRRFSLLLDGIGNEPSVPLVPEPLKEEDATAISALIIICGFLSRTRYKYVNTRRAAAAGERKGKEEVNGKRIAKDEDKDEVFVQAETVHQTALSDNLLDDVSVMSVQQQTCHTVQVRQASTLKVRILKMLPSTSSAFPYLNPNFDASKLKDKIQKNADRILSDMKQTPVDANVATSLMPQFSPIPLPSTHFNPSSEGITIVERGKRTSSSSAGGSSSLPAGSGSGTVSNSDIKVKTTVTTEYRSALRQNRRSTTASPSAYSATSSPSVQPGRRKAQTQRSSTSSKTGTTAATKNSTGLTTQDEVETILIISSSEEEDEEEVTVSDEDENDNQEEHRAFYIGKSTSNGGKEVEEDDDDDEEEEEEEEEEEGEEEKYREKERKQPAIVEKRQRPWQLSTARTLKRKRLSAEEHEKRHNNRLQDSDDSDFEEESNDRVRSSASEQKTLPRKKSDDNHKRMTSSSSTLSKIPPSSLSKPTDPSEDDRYDDDHKEEDNPKGKAASKTFIPATKSMMKKSSNSFVDAIVQKRLQKEKEKQRIRFQQSEKGRSGNSSGSGDRDGRAVENDPNSSNVVKVPERSFDMQVPETLPGSVDRASTLIPVNTVTGKLNRKSSTSSDASAAGGVDKEAQRSRSQNSIHPKERALASATTVTASSGASRQQQPAIKFSQGFQFVYETQEEQGVVAEEAYEFESLSPKNYPVELPRQQPVSSRPYARISQADANSAMMGEIPSDSWESDAEEEDAYLDTEDEHGLDFAEHNSKKESASLTNRLFKLAMLCICAGVLHWFVVIGSKIQYCGSDDINELSDDTSSLKEEMWVWASSNPLQHVLPRCVPCPTGAICAGREVVSCSNSGIKGQPMKGLVMKPNGFIRLIKGQIWLKQLLGSTILVESILPFPLASPVCMHMDQDVAGRFEYRGVPDTEGTAASIQQAPYHFRTKHPSPTAAVADVNSHTEEEEDRGRMDNQHDHEHEAWHFGDTFSVHLPRMPEKLTALRDRLQEKFASVIDKLQTYSNDVSVNGGRIRLNGVQPVHMLLGGSILVATSFVLWLSHVVRNRTRAEQLCAARAAEEVLEIMKSAHALDCEEEESFERDLRSTKADKEGAHHSRRRPRLATFPVDQLQDAVLPPLEEEGLFSGWCAIDRKRVWTRVRGIIMRDGRIREVWRRQTHGDISMMWEWDGGNVDASNVTRSPALSSEHDTLYGHVAPSAEKDTIVHYQSVCL